MDAISAENEVSEEANGITASMSHFADKDYVTENIQLICAAPHSFFSSIYGKDPEFLTKFELLDTCLSKYQEQPTLLAPSLPELVEPLMDTLLGMINEKDISMLITSEQSNDSAKDEDEEKTLSGSNSGSGCSVWRSSNEFGVKFDGICRVLQLICRVRGFKHVVKLFPHEVSHLEPCLYLLQSHDRKNFSNWETRFVLLLWLCILCLIPFDICSIDSSMNTNTTTGGDANDNANAPAENSNEPKSTLVQHIIDICQTFLADTGPTREAASACLSALLTRPDMDSSLLLTFIDSSCSKMNSWVNKGDSAQQELTVDSFEIIGVLHCISQIFKKGHRSRILPHATTILTPCLAIAAQDNQVLVRKLTCKLTQRIGMTFLPPKVASWRYQRGSRSLLKNLTNETDIENETSDGPAKTKSSSENNIDMEEDEEVPEQLEDIIEHLLQSIQDKDTVVRWNAAKGIGRTTMRLSKAFADDVVGAVLELFEDPDADSAWHGGCLALAELTRRGLLLPERLEEVMPVIEKAILYDVLRGQHSVGSHVRDAACYVCWAFARAYSPTVMQPFIQTLAGSMLITGLYDREINCRRAASAAFQENVGRQGNENFPDGIEIITIADYFSLGNRTNAYLTIAPEVAKMNDSFHEVLMDHLISSKICHWEPEMRSLASKALAELAIINTTRTIAALEKLLESSFSTNFTTRHGSILSVAEITLALCHCDVSLSDSQIENIVNLVPKLDKARLFRGRGGELLRQASCLLINNIAKAAFPFPIKTKVTLVEFLNENIKHPHDYISIAATDALREFLFAYFSRGDDEPTERLQKLTVTKYLDGINTEDNVAATRGYALAIGALPLKLLCKPTGRLDSILAGLTEGAREDRKISGDTDAETRRNCIKSVSEILEKISLTPYFDKARVDTCFNILFKASLDHSVDKRGDTGSWSRIEALKGMERMLYAYKRNINFTDSIENFYMTSYGIASCQDNMQKFIVMTFPISSLGYGYSAEAGDSTSIKKFCTMHCDSISSINKLEIQSKDFMNAEFQGHCQRITGIILEQLAEKLDSVREIAGQCLQRILFSELHQEINEIPDRDIIKAAIKKVPESESINWAHPAHVFPILLQIMDSKAYFHSIFSGTVISIGGLSETVVKESTNAILQFFKSRNNGSKKDKGIDEFILLACESLLLLFEKFHNEDRVIIPLIKTVDVLLRNSVFENLRPHSHPFLVDILQILQKHSTSSTNIIKIKGCIDIMMRLLLFEDPVRGKALKYLVIFLGHKFPRVRKHAAEGIYVQFLSDQYGIGPTIEDTLEILEKRESESQGSAGFVDALRCGLARNTKDLEAAQDLLVTITWDGSLAESRTNRSSLCNLLGLQMNVRAVNPNARKVEEKPKDELDSYESLVRSAGY